jgi:hypothetical protein
MTMRDFPTETNGPAWRQAVAGGQILFVAFGALAILPQPRTPA